MEEGEQRRLLHVVATVTDIGLPLLQLSAARLLHVRGALLQVVPAPGACCAAAHLSAHCAPEASQGLGRAHGGGLHLCHPWQLGRGAWYGRRMPCCSLFWRTPNAGDTIVLDFFPPALPFLHSTSLLNSNPTRLDFRLRDLARRVPEGQVTVDQVTEACRPFLLAAEQALLQATTDIEQKMRRKGLRECLLVVAVGGAPFGSGACYDRLVYSFVMHLSHVIFVRSCAGVWRDDGRRCRLV